MTTTNRLLAIFNTLLAIILVLVLIQFAPSVANANSTTIVACANKKTGDLRIAYKKCSKNENKVTWGIGGKEGAAGPQGQKGDSGKDAPDHPVVKDANGIRVPNVLTISNDGTPYVLHEGKILGLNLYSGSYVESRNANITYSTSNCTGNPVLVVYELPVDYRFWSMQSIGAYDSVTSSRLPGLFKIQPPAIQGDTYLVKDGMCEVADQSFYIPLVEISPPPSLSGPLSIVFE